MRDPLESARRTTTAMKGTRALLAGIVLLFSTAFGLQETPPTQPSGSEAASAPQEDPSADQTPAAAPGGEPAAAGRAPEEARPQPAPSPRQFKSAAVITIRDEITDVTTQSLRRRIEAARRIGADLLVFELDTPGGYVGSALDIAHMIENLRDLATVAWVNPQAHSAGTMIALACNEIVMAPSSTMGDSQVIMLGKEGLDAVPDALRPKVYTPVLARFRASAKLNGYSEVLCEAFVVPEREVWWLEDAETGRREFVFREEKLRRLGDAGADDSVVQRATRSLLGLSDAPPGGAWKLVDSYFDIVTGTQVSFSQPVERADELLEMDAGRAAAFGFNRAIVADVSDLRSRYGLASVVSLNSSWSENMTGYLTSPFVRGFLLIVFLLGAYMEFHTPGLGLAGLVALIALVLFVGAPYLTGLANIWELVVIALGLVLIAVEAFVIPGFGVAGVTGILCLLVGLVATFMPDEPGRTTPFYIPELRPTLDGLYTGIKTVLVCMVASFAGMLLLARYLPKMPAFEHFIPVNPTGGTVAVEDPYFGLAQPGQRGVAQGPLRPAGKARFGEVLVDVVTQGEFVDSGQKVEVMHREGNRVVVRAI